LEETLKTCSKCKIAKGTSQFYRDKLQKDGYRPDCKNCSNALKKVYREKNKTKIAIKKKIYREKNKERLILKDRLRYQNNKPRFLAQHYLWIKNNKEKNDLLRNNWRKKNPDKVRASAINQIHKRRSQTKETDITTSWLLQLKEESEICSICGQRMDEIKNSHHKKSLDHIMPLKAGGKHTKANVRFVCIKCNQERPRDGRDIKCADLQSTM
jgi:hypothetical protein